MLCDSEIFSAQISRLRATTDLHVFDVDAVSVSLAVEEILSIAPPLFALVGFSLGGIVAMACATRAPTRVSHLGLIATNSAGPRPEQIELWNAWQQYLADDEFDRAVEEATSAMLPGAEQEFWPLALRMAARVGPKTFDRQLQLQKTRVDLASELHKIRAPTAIIGGQLDPLCPPSRHEQIRANIVAADLTLFPDCGHLVTVERPDDTSELLAALLDRPAYQSD